MAQLSNNPIYILLGILLGLVASLILLRLVFRKLHNKIQHSKTSWDDLILNSIQKPTQVLLLYFWVQYALHITQTHFIALPTLFSLLNLTPLLLIVWTLFRFVDKLAIQLNKVKANVDADSIYLIVRLIKILLILITVLMVAQYFGLSIASILTFGGMSGIVIGFAAKDMLANIFGGLMLQIDKPFSTGDWIRSDEKGFEGTVEKIGWRMTKIITFSKNPIYIPNAIFSNIHIETPSRMRNRRIKATIGVRYDDVANILLIISKIKEYLQNHSEIDQNNTLMVNLSEFNAYSVDFFIYTFTNTTNWQKFHAIKQEVLLSISDIISQHGAQIAYPTQVLNLNTDTTTELKT